MTLKDAIIIFVHEYPELMHKYKFHTETENYYIFGDKDTTLTSDPVCVDKRTFKAHGYLPPRDGV